ncbi:MAG: hypothetical protein K8J08_22280 [Thermoanaerobaculia bacterium]|nr:hypothetical protein [Thermoanaerobaculia bacterium]
MLVLVMFGLLVVGAGVYHAVKIRRSRHWPEVTARVVERDRSSPVEFVGGEFVANLDSDHFLEYEVDGRVYRHRVPDQATVTTMGFKVWRKKPELHRVVVRCHPRYPRIHVESDTTLLAPVLAIVVGLSILGFALLAPHLVWEVEAGGLYRLHWKP